MEHLLEPVIMACYSDAGILLAYVLPLAKTVWWELFDLEQLFETSRVTLYSSMASSRALAIFMGMGMYVKLLFKVVTHLRIHRSIQSHK